LQKSIGEKGRGDVVMGKHKVVAVVLYSSIDVSLQTPIVMIVTSWHKAVYNVPKYSRELHVGKIATTFSSVIRQTS